MEKLEIRNKMIYKRDSLSIDIKNQYDNVIFKKLISSEVYSKSKSIFTYISFGSEVDTKQFIDYALKDNKEIYVPKVDKTKREMKAVKIHNLNNMNVDKWGILEPRLVDESDIGNSFDLIIMPGVAFDRFGNRIGYGGGYYDKYISLLTYKCNKTALAYDFQIISHIKPDKHDVKVDNIITNIEL